MEARRGSTGEGGGAFKVKPTPCGASRGSIEVGGGHRFVSLGLLSVCGLFVYCCLF